MLLPGLAHTPALQLLDPPASQSKAQTQPYLHFPRSIIHHLLLGSHLGLGVQRGGVKLHLLYLGCGEGQRAEAHPAGL